MLLTMSPLTRYLRPHWQDILTSLLAQIIYVTTRIINLRHNICYLQCHHSQDTYDPTGKIYLILYWHKLLLRHHWHNIITSLLILDTFTMSPRKRYVRSHWQVIRTSLLAQITSTSQLA